jgi:hypothetical protein
MKTSNVMTRTDAFNKSMAGVIAFIVEGVEADLRENKNLDLILSVYNEVMDDERDGTDYIFNIHNKDDVKFLVSNDLMTATDIAFVVNNPDIVPNGLFFMNNGAESMQPVKHLAIVLNNWVTEMTKFAVLYVARGSENSPYKAFYEKYFVDRVWQTDIFYNIL